MMKDMIILILVIYIIMVGMFGGFALYLSNPYDNGAYKWFWKYLREDFNIIGCIIIYVISFPAILLTILTDVSWGLFYKICDLFYMIFKRR